MVKRALATYKLPVEQNGLEVGEFYYIEVALMNAKESYVKVTAYEGQIDTQPYAELTLSRLRDVSDMWELAKGRKLDIQYVY